MSIVLASASIIASAQTAVTSSKAADGSIKISEDENLVSKILPNGVEIVVFKNAEPPNRASMRLVIKRGAACENESERGLAHFTEHMAFNGTKNFPSGAMVEYFQRLGMAFGADTNAYTSFDETVYKLDLPDVSKKLIDDGLTLLRDYAGNIDFEQSAIDKERGVILAEKDARESQDYRKSVAEIEQTLNGLSHSKRMPIGLEKVIKNSTRENFLGFYRATYRPENTVVVIVGDVDVNKTLAEAEAKFSDFKAYDGVPDRPRNFGKLKDVDVSFAFKSSDLPNSALYYPVANSSSSSATLNAARNMPESDSLAKRVLFYRMKAISNALDARVARIASLPNSKISSGGVSFYYFSPKVAIFSVGADSPVGKAEDALAETIRQILSSNNLSLAEMEKGKNKIFAELEDCISAKGSRKTSVLADEIATSRAEGDLYTSPEDDLKIAKSALDGFDQKDAIEALRDWLSHSDITLFATDTVKEIDGGELAINAKATASVTPWPSDAFNPQVLKFSDFGKAGKIVEKSVIDDLGIVRVRFGNGVRLNIKKTDFAKDEIITRVSFGNGLLDLPSPEYYFALAALELGGTKYQTLSELLSAKFGKKLWISSGIAGNSFYLSNATTVRDFPDFVKYCATLVLDAAFRDSALSVLQKQAQKAYLDLKTDPTASLRFISLKLLDSKILNGVPGDFDSFKKISMSDIAKWLKPILEKSYMEISVVGAVDLDSTIELFSKTFGAGELVRDSKKIDPMVSLKFAKTGENLSFKYDANDEPRSVAVKIWKSCDKSDIEDMRDAAILGDVLDDVMRKDIREEDGKVYSPYAYNSSSNWVRDWGMLIALSMVTPDYNGEISEKIEKCAQKVKESITLDQFERAKLPILKQIEANLRNNSYWLDGVLDLSQARPYMLELARTIVSGYKNVTIESVREYAEKIFEKKPYSVSVMPE